MSACGRLKSSAIFDTPSIERKGLFLFPLNMNMSSYWSSLIHLMRKKTKVMICGKEHSTLEKKILTVLINGTHCKWYYSANFRS